jgi:hypothetical protein
MPRALSPMFLPVFGLGLPHSPFFCFQSLLPLSLSWFHPHSIMRPILSRPTVSHSFSPCPDSSSPLPSHPLPPSPLSLHPSRYHANYTCRSYLLLPTLFVTVWYHTIYATPWIFPPLAFYGTDLLLRIVRWRLVVGRVEGKEGGMSLVSLLVPLRPFLSSFSHVRGLADIHLADPYSTRFNRLARGAARPAARVDWGEGVGGAPAERVQCAQWRGLFERCVFGRSLYFRCALLEEWWYGVRSATCAFLGISADLGGFYSRRTRLSRASPRGACRRSRRGCMGCSLKRIGRCIASFRVDPHCTFLCHSIPSCLFLSVMSSPQSQLLTSLLSRSPRWLPNRHAPRRARMR